jgi:outer membrane scaffolding protein for murein synthesis (MipA/OmpV family)
LVRGLVGSAGWTRILNDAEDSPLVDGNGGVGAENQFSGVLAVIYAF